MKKLLSLCFGVVFVWNGFAQTKAEEINELLKAYSKQSSFSGAALVAKNGEILLEKGYGTKDLRGSVGIDSNTLFLIGGLTQQFTAALILQLQEKGMLSLQDSLSKFIPDYPEGGKITLENLLTHSSGIFNYSEDLAFMQREGAKASPPLLILHSFQEKPLLFRPGSRYGFSNSNYFLLGYIIEKITGESYFELVRNTIFLPLGMKHSGFNFKSLRNTNKATGYQQIHSRQLEPMPLVDSTVSFSAGSIYSTVGDLYKWIRALESGKILQPASLKQAFTPYKSKFGYSWLIDTVNEKQVLMSLGGISGFGSFIALIPADKTCIILLDNKSSEGLPKIAENINSILNEQPYDFPVGRKEIAVDSASLVAYTGSYQLAPDFILQISMENGLLVVAAPGQGKSALYAEKENLFFFKLSNDEIEFIKTPEGKVERLIYYQAGEKLPAVKIK